MLLFSWKTIQSFKLAIFLKKKISFSLKVQTCFFKSFNFLLSCHFLKKNVLPYLLCDWLATSWGCSPPFTQNLLGLAPTHPVTLDQDQRCWKWIGEKYDCIIATFFSFQAILFLFFLSQKCIILKVQNSSQGHNGLRFPSRWPGKQNGSRLFLPALNMNVFATLRTHARGKENACAYQCVYLRVCLCRCLPGCVNLWMRVRMWADC